MTNSTDGVPPCQHCGAPVYIRQVPTPDQGSRFTKSIPLRVCTNRECRTNMPGQLAP